jgi:hypothetical protein
MNRTIVVHGPRSFVFTCSIGICIAVGFGVACHAVQLAYDPFLIGPTPAAGEYTLGPLVGQNPTIGPAVPSFFSGPWQGQGGSFPIVGPTVQSGSPSYIGLSSPGGSANGGGNSNGRAARQLAVGWDNSTSGTYYVGFVVNFGTIGGSSDNNMGYRSVEFWRGPIGDEVFPSAIGYNQFTSSFGPSQMNAATAKMQMNIVGAPQQIVSGAPDSYNFDGATHLIVVKFALSSAPLSDAVSMYLDPLPTFPDFVFAEPAIPSASVSGIDFTLQAIGTSSDFGGGAFGSVFDELRVGTTFADAAPSLPSLVPEPSGLILTLSAAVAFASFVRGRRAIPARPGRG